MSSLNVRILNNATDTAGILAVVFQRLRRVAHARICGSQGRVIHRCPDSVDPTMHPWLGCATLVGQQRPRSCIHSPAIDPNCITNGRWLMR